MPVKTVGKSKYSEALKDPTIAKLIFGLSDDFQNQQQLKGDLLRSTNAFEKLREMRNDAAWKKAEEYSNGSVDKHVTGEIATSRNARGKKQERTLWLKLKDEPSEAHFPSLGDDCEGFDLKILRCKPGKRPCAIEVSAPTLANIKCVCE